MPLPLPLLDRATAGDWTHAYITRRGPAGLPVPDASAPSPASRMPARPPGPGEQYRFHFDMRLCIGCKCCVVACNEQNGNPAEVTWRRVGEIEGGVFPHATQHYLSMGCNHCLEPTCLQGCPVDAYAKDPATGIVTHSAEACIGCQYCTWSCSYGVPQYNAERGVVGKCDMCHGRLSRGHAPACVGACPQGAIQIEIVNRQDWRAAVQPVAGAGAPVDDRSLSTTRVTLPELPADARPRDIATPVRERVHWSLVIMTVLTQLSAGALATVWIVELGGGATRAGAAAMTALAVGSLALGAATLHLGRPVHAYRALRMWRRSWISREVLLFSIFSAMAAAYAAVLWCGWPGGAALGALASLAGAAGVAASARIYRVASRPAWDTAWTPASFLLTAGLLGPLLAGLFGAGGAAPAAAAALMAALQGLAAAGWFAGCLTSDGLERRSTARLLVTTLARPFFARIALLVAGGLVLPLLRAAWEAPAPAIAGLDAVLAAALALALSGELLGRYLFFAAAVPRHLAAAYVPGAREAA